MKKNKSLFFLSVIFFQYFTLFSQVIINEYSCANLSSYADNYTKYEDWIELYNTTNNPVDITDFYISDRTSKPTKWKIPVTNGTIIPAKGFLIIFASNRDTAINFYFHTNFALKQTRIPAEQIVLSSPSGMIIDSVNISVTQLGHSYGRTTDGASTWGVFSVPTPAISNNMSTPVKYAAKPVFSQAPGFYLSTVAVGILTTEPNSTIRYTTDGTEPTQTSAVYTTPVEINKTTVLKAKVFSNDINTLPGFLVYGTYFINVNHILPVVSVSGNDITTLLNGNGSLRPFGSIEYYGADKLLKESSTGEFNQHGKDSWSCDQRSIDFIARDEMGDDYALRVPYIQATDRSEYQRVLLRASGDDNYPCGHNPLNKGSAHMRDGYIHNLAKKGKLHLDVRACERVVMYANGQYWGVYEIRENPDDHDYTKYYYDQDKYHLQYIMVWGFTWAEYGGNQALMDWETFYTYAMNTTMDLALYTYIDSLFNIKSFVDYILVNSFTVCSDWLNWNTAWWRGLNPKGDHKKWGYILWDNDATFAFYFNYTGIPDTSATALPCNPEKLTDPYSDPEGHIKLLNKLNQFPAFHQYYVARQADLLNTTFSCDTMLSYLYQYAKIIDPEMTMHASRWNGTYNEWETNVKRLQNFIERRCYALETGIKDCYSLTGPFDLTLDANPEGYGSVKVNSLKISQFPWTGKYYGGMDTKLKATPVDSTKNFVNWSAKNHTFSPNSAAIDVVISLTTIDTVTAYFQTLQISEILSDNTTVSVYPTVITDFVTLDFSLTQPDIVNIELYNLSGKKITALSPSVDYTSMGDYTVKIDFSKTTLSPDAYILKFSTKHYTKSYKIIYLGN